MNVIPTNLIHDTVVATHMTGGIELRAALTLLLLVAGVAVAAAALAVERARLRAAVVALGLAVLAIGGVSFANTEMRHHIHLCHEHAGDSCGPGHKADGGVDPEHLLGRW